MKLGDAHDCRRAGHVADRVAPVGLIRADREYVHAVPLRVIDQHCRRVEPHRLSVQQRRQEFGRKVRLQVRAGIGQQGEASRVRTGKAV